MSELVGSQTQIKICWHSHCCILFWLLFLFGSGPVDLQILTLKLCSNNHLLNRWGSQKNAFNLLILARLCNCKQTDKNMRRPGNSRVLLQFWWHFDSVFLQHRHSCWNVCSSKVQQFATEFYAARWPRNMKINQQANAKFNGAHLLAATLKQHGRLWQGSSLAWLQDLIKIVNLTTKWSANCASVFDCLDWMRPPSLTIRQCHVVHEREDLQTKWVMCWVKKWQSNGGVCVFVCVADC